MSLDEGKTISVIEGFVELRLRHNRGVAWGIGADLPTDVQRGVFPLVSALIGFVLVLYYNRIPVEERLRRVSVALVLGGGLGNLLDRVRSGSVTDFIALHSGGAGWTMSGTFNLGDVWLVVGVVMLSVLTVARPVARGQGGSMSDGGSP
jgi:signal peptidase II